MLPIGRTPAAPLPPGNELLGPSIIHVVMMGMGSDGVMKPLGLGPNSEQLHSTAGVNSVSALTPLQSSGASDVTIKFPDQTANKILAGPASGGAAQPAFRSAVKADQVAATAYTDAANAFAANQSVAGNVTLTTAGNGIAIKEGSNATVGLATLIAGAVTVNTTKVTANSRIFTAHQNVSGTPGVLSISARTPGASFVISSTDGTDTSDVAWWILEPA